MIMYGTTHTSFTKSVYHLASDSTTASYAYMTDTQNLFRHIQLYKIPFSYAYIYRSYMRHLLLIENKKCIQGCFIYFNMEFVLQI